MILYIEASLPSFCVQAMPMNDIPQSQSARGAIGIEFCQGWLDPLCVNTAFVRGGEPRHSVMTHTRVQLCQGK